MNKIILTVIVTLAIIIAAILIYMYSGMAGIGQQSDNSLSEWVLTTTRNHSLRHEIKGIKEPAMNDTAAFKIGFAHYNEMCTTCHGGPGISPDELSKGLFPKPPEFYKSKDLPSPAATFWVIKHGFKYTGMPAFGPTHDDKKIWAITDFLLNKMNKMSPEEYHEWQLRYADKGD